MMKKKHKIVIPIVIIILIFSVSSCNMPFKIVPNVSTTPPPPITNTPSPAASTQPPVEPAQTTPTPEKTTEQAEFVPVTGSVLTWIDYSNFVYVPEGEFTMGKENILPDEFNPAHKVTMSGFWIHQAEVTNQQYASCVDAGVCSAPNKEQGYPYWYAQPDKTNDPVVGVTWSQAKQFCEFIKARLPSEAEWEKTARGTKDEVYPWGTEQPNCSLLNFNKCLKTPQPDEVRSYMSGASDYEALDLAGNVFEWVSDWYGENYYNESPASNPTGPSEGIYKVYRGGGFLSSEVDVSATSRFFTEPEQHSADLGFRCVLVGDPTKSTSETVGQPCQVLGNITQLESQPTYTPYPCEQPSVVGYCELLGGKASYGVDIRQKGCLSNKLNSMTGNSQPLTCSVHQLQNGGNQYLCTFPGMAQGINVEVRFCHSFSAQISTIECPSGYKLNSTNNLCELEYTKLPGPPCPKGYLDVPPNGCMPINDPKTGGCPAGFYSVVSPLTSVCMPLNACLLANAPESCTNPTCAAGETFDTAKGCCASPDTPNKVCPAKLFYNAETNACIGSDMYPHECPVVQAKIPICPTVTPTSTPTLVPQSNCHQERSPTGGWITVCD